MWMRDRISAAEILAADEENSDISEALHDVTGDAYLIANNPIYRTIRRRALMIGVRYSCKPTSLWRTYQALSLVCLPEILRQQVVPYTPTREVVIELNRQNVAFRAEWFVGNLCHNAMLHESAHCIAQRTLTDTIRLPVGNKSVWSAILGESFANAVEKLASTRVQSGLDWLLFSLNSYATSDVRQYLRLRDAIRFLGFEVVFRLLFCSYVAANLRPAQARLEDIELARETAIGSLRRSLPVDLCRDIVIIGFGLNPLFRKETASVYFQTQGLESEYRELIRQSPLRIRSIGRALGVIGGRFARLLEPTGVAGKRRRRGSVL
jgi:hypothetical protein